MAETTTNEPDVVEQGTYYLLNAPIAELAEYAGVSIDEAVNMRVNAVRETAPPLKLEVQVRPIEPKGNLLGFASVKLNGGFVVDDFKVLQSDKGIFVGMPSKPDKGSKTGYRDTARPITADFRAMLTEAVTTAYHEAVQKLQSRVAALPTADKKQSIQKQLENGAKPSAKENTTRTDPAKGSKTKSAERG